MTIVTTHDRYTRPLPGGDRESGRGMKREAYRPLLDRASEHIEAAVLSRGGDPA